MIKYYKIIKESGLHSKPAYQLVQEAGKCDNEITISYKKTTVTLKSIMAVLSLGVPVNSVIQIEVTGENQAEVFSKLEKVLVTHNLI